MERKQDQYRELIYQLELRPLAWVMRCWVVRGKDGNWRWQKTARNGRIFSSSVEYFHDKSNARRALRNELNLGRLHMVICR